MISRKLHVPWETSTDPNGGESESPPLPPVPAHLSPSQQQALQQLLAQYKDIFARSSQDLGKSKLLEHHIQVTSPPIRQPIRRQPPGRRQEEEQQVQEMFAQGIISPSQSPWSSPAVLVKKKDGTFRFCVDYRKLNTVTVKDAHPLPRIDDTLEMMHGCRYFSTLDLVGGGAHHPPPSVCYPQVTDRRWPP